MGGVITVTVETDEEQAALGLALVNGALGFGGWPVAFLRQRYMYAGAGGGGSTGGTWQAGGGGCGDVHLAGGTGAGPVPGYGAGGGTGDTSAGGGAGARVLPGVVHSVPLRSCCATYLNAVHRDGCGETGT
jgi:hypothetical protein